MFIQKSKYKKTLLMGFKLTNNTSNTQPVKTQSSI